VGGGKQLSPVGHDDDHMSNHARVHVVIHATWRTFRRGSTISPSIEELLRDSIVRQCVRLGLSLYGFGASEDHLHVVFSLPANLTIAAAIKALKGASGSVLQRESAHSVGWSTGYFAASARADDLETLLDYVRTQRDRHSAKRLETR
jgi:putative transposase